LKGGNKKIEYKETKKISKEVIDEILIVKEKKGLTAENLLNSARKKSSSLNKLFDWDDSTAAENWRMQQARQIINEVKIIVEDKELFAFENIRISVDEQSGESIEKSKRVYEGIVEIMNDKEKRSQLILRALQEAKYWKERHSQFVELKTVFESIDREEKIWQKKQ